MANVMKKGTAAYNYTHTMRGVADQLARELGASEGANVFAWYCEYYGLTIADACPANIRYEVFGF